MYPYIQSVPGTHPTINDFPYGYANNYRRIIPELKFHYSILNHIPLIHFVNCGVSFDTIFHKFEYQIKEIVDYRLSNNIRKIYFYDGAKIALPFHCTFCDPANQDFFEISIWNLNGAKIIFNKIIKFKNKNSETCMNGHTEWYNFILPIDVVDEIGHAVREYHEHVIRYL